MSTSPKTVATVYTEALGQSSGPLRCQLVVVEGPDMGRAARLDVGSVLLVGTEPSCGLVLSDERVSRKHLSVLARPDGRFDMQDLDSRNGTLYEGSLLHTSTVSPGATLKLGRSFLRIQPRPEALDLPPSRSQRFGDLVGVSLAMREVFAVLELAAQADVTVLLEGETGTGKELAARALHEASPRQKGPFVAVDCGALPETLLESELFGHTRGAFTGANQARAGAFVRAHGGTLFLDELGGISQAAQARLLRVLEERKIKPVGADQERPVDVRVIAASRHDLSARVAEGAFRPDLLYRLAVVRVSLPSLRQRREDIGPIATALLRRRGLEPGPIAGPNADRLLAHNWPGNVRELRNVIDRAVALSPGARSFGDLRLSVAPPSDDEGLPLRLDLPFSEAKQLLVEAFERRYLRALRERSEDTLSAASRLSGIDRKQLRLLLRKHGLARPSDDDL
jgi:DNA-binding NtrC family response regulator